MPPNSTYTIRVYREREDRSADKTLEVLTVMTVPTGEDSAELVTLDPTFEAEPNASMRTATAVANAVSSVTVTATPERRRRYAFNHSCRRFFWQRGPSGESNCRRREHHNRNGNGGGRQHAGLHHNGVPHAQFGI